MANMKQVLGISLRRHGGRWRSDSQTPWSRFVSRGDEVIWGIWTSISWLMCRSIRADMPPQSAIPESGQVGAIVCHSTVAFQLPMSA